MRSFSVLISILVTITGLCAANTVPCDTILRFDAKCRAEYVLTIDYGDNSFTGICVMKHTAGKICGSAMNEFGVKAFDFIYETETGSINLQNVIYFMNRRMVKRTISSDWKYLLSSIDGIEEDKNRKITINGSGEIVLENSKRNIRYVLVPLAHHDK